MPTDALYETDFVLWTGRQAEVLREAVRQGSNLPVDWDNLAEEIESVGKRDRREAESYVRLILTHLIKLAYSSAIDPRAGWIDEVGAYRGRLERVLRDSPSLRARLAETIGAELGAAAREARSSLRKYGHVLPDNDEVLTRFRSVGPEQLLDEGWLPPDGGVDGP